MNISLKATTAATILLIALSGISVVCAQSADLRNDASKYTIAANLLANNSPAWLNNQEDFEFANIGFIATDSPLIIPSDYPGFTTWNMEEFSFLDNMTCPPYKPSSVPARESE